ncbi:hypothetical protein B0H10DRAFT_2441178 [Mycena sp. CBHHK59/15]|nr:hypothetical protein B0H10DRAFT_2441178 [Mycena sp. CBHHK59/15]
MKLALKEVTSSSLSAAATVARFVLSPDREWSSKGALSGTNWEEDYRNYQKLLTTNHHLPHVKNIFKTVHNFVFAGIKLSSAAANSDPDDDTEDAIIDAMRRFELGTDAAADDNDAHAGAAAVAPGPEPIFDPPAGMPDEPEVEVPVPAVSAPAVPAPAVPAPAGPTGSRGGNRTGRGRAAAVSGRATAVSGGDIEPRTTRSRRGNENIGLRA